MARRVMFMLVSAVCIMAATAGTAVAAGHTGIGTVALNASGTPVWQYVRPTAVPGSSFAHFITTAGGRVWVGGQMPGDPGQGQDAIILAWTM